MSGVDDFDTCDIERVLVEKSALATAKGSADEFRILANVNAVAADDA